MQGNVLQVVTGDTSIGTKFMEVLPLSKYVPHVVNVMHSLCAAPLLIAMTPFSLLSSHTCSFAMLSMYIASLYNESFCFCGRTTQQHPLESTKTSSLHQVALYHIDASIARPDQQQPSTHTTVLAREQVYPPKARGSAPTWLLRPFQQPQHLLAASSSTS